ncbi:hypothetical protein D3OALGB2SA_788 [Olavius algarvensis associated proteobacterium Delta 3]|nr:hypothetical protein D3OALGB2SA_788 [Olavius algarvensis associated proteobacterium Delta 3]
MPEEGGPVFVFQPTSFLTPAGCRSAMVTLCRGQLSDRLRYPDARTVNFDG